MSLLQKVQGHVRGQRTSGQNTLALTVECIDHMFGDSGDWTPLAYLIGKSETAQSRAVRRVVGQVVVGYALVKDDTQSSGLRFTKRKGANVGLVEDKMDQLRDLVAQKKSIQSGEVKVLTGKPKVTKDFEVKAWADRVVKAHPDQLEAMIAALQAKRQAASVNF